VPFKPSFMLGFFSPVRIVGGRERRGARPRTPMRPSRCRPTRHHGHRGGAPV